MIIVIRIVIGDRGAVISTLKSIRVIMVNAMKFCIKLMDGNSDYIIEEKKNK